MFILEMSKDRYDLLAVKNGLNNSFLEEFHANRYSEMV